MDPISNMLTSVRNASAKRKERVDVPFSNIKANIVKVLKDEGFISNYKVLDPKTDKTLDRRGVIRIALKYTQNKKPVLVGAGEKRKSRRRGSLPSLVKRRGAGN